MANFKEKINKARLAARDPKAEKLATDLFLRQFSIYVSYFLARLGVTANQVTVAIAICCSMGALCYFPRNIYINILGIFFLFLMYFLDVVDGEVARLRNECSVVGIYLDFATHQIANPLFALFFGLHVYFLAKSNLVLLMTLLLYSTLNWHRGVTTGSRAALLKFGYKGDREWKSGKTADKKVQSERSVFFKLARFPLSISAMGLLGLCLVASYIIGTKILYLYLAVYTALVTVAFAGSVIRDIVRLGTLRIEQPEASKAN